MDSEIADNTDELIEAMKEGFAVRLADVETKAEKYRLALVACREFIEDDAEWNDGRAVDDLYLVIVEALK